MTLLGRGCDGQGSKAGTRECKCLQQRELNIVCGNERVKIIIFPAQDPVISINHTSIFPDASAKQPTTFHKTLLPESKIFLRGEIKVDEMTT